MELCKLTSKSIVAFAGVIFFMISALLLAISITVMSSYGHLGDDVFKHFYTLFPVVVLLVASIFFGLAGVVACFGAINQNKCLLTLLGAILVLIIATMLLGIVGIEKSKPVVKEALQNATVEAMNEYGQVNYTDITNDVDFVQASLHCCGSESASDWKTTPFFKETNMFPKSCCNFDNGKCNGTQPFDDINLTWSAGCFDLVERRLAENARYIMIGTGVVLAILVLMLIATVALCFYKRRHQDLPYSSLVQ